MSKTFLALGAIFGALAVAGGAFGAHALKHQLDADRWALFEMAARYQMYHALALLATGYAIDRWPSASATSAGWLFVIGTLIFCGTIYALAFGSPRWFGAITPIGGVCLISAWVLLAFSAFQRR